MRYRVLTRLSNGQEPGDMFTANIPQSVLEKLVHKGAIAPLATPPLSILAGWQTRAEKLAAIGVETVEQFLEAEPEKLAEACNVKPQTVARWAKELEGMLSVQPHKKH